MNDSNDSERKWVHPAEREYRKASVMVEENWQWKVLTCVECGKTSQCTPWNDYWECNECNKQPLCEKCYDNNHLKKHMKGIRIVDNRFPKA